MLQQCSIVPLNVLDNPKQTSYQNKARYNVQHRHHLLPWHSGIIAGGSRSLGTSRVDDGAAEYEEAEEDDLQEQSADDDLLACLHG